MIILAAMACSWLFRSFLLRTLRQRYPDQFAALGQPSSRQLASHLPRHRELQIQFWKFLWGGRVFRIDDKLVKGLARAALISDAALLIGVAVLLWSAGK